MAVLSLLSDSVARFTLAPESQRGGAESPVEGVAESPEGGGTEEDPDPMTVDCLVRRRSLYIMKDSSRYDFKHAILSSAESESGVFNVSKDRRISVVCRCEPS